MVPAAFTFRVLPLGQDRAVQPYVGGGLNVIAWRYSESGQFVGLDRTIAECGLAVVRNPVPLVPLAFRDRRVRLYRPISRKIRAAGAQ